MGNESYRKQNSDGSILKWIGRFVLVAIVLVITSFVTPGFSIHGLWSFY